MKMNGLCKVTTWVKVLPFYLFTFLPLHAQTVSSVYQPGVTAEGAVYFLPKTAITVTVTVEKTTYTPGDLCQYAERYLRIKDVSPAPSVGYRITAIRQEASAVPDTTKRYAVKFDPKNAATNIRLSDDGVLLGINTERKVESGKWKENTPGAGHLGSNISPSPKPNPRQYMNEETLAAGSTAKMAELTAQDIYDIRESRSLLVRGQADNMPKDGEQLRLMLSQLDLQDRALTSLFTGTYERDTMEQAFTIVPDERAESQQPIVLFRFSQKLGIVDADDLAGVPYYINIENLRSVPPPAPADPKKKQKPIYGIYVNIPGRLRSTLSDGQRPIMAEEFPAGQFGNVELLSGALFNKRYTTRLQLYPLSGAIEHLDAELPR